MRYFHGLVSINLSNFLTKIFGIAIFIFPEILHATTVIELSNFKAIVIAATGVSIILASPLNSTPGEGSNNVNKSTGEIKERTDEKHEPNREK